MSAGEQLVTNLTFQSDSRTSLVRLLSCQTEWNAKTKLSKLVRLAAESAS